MFIGTICGYTEERSSVPPSGGGGGTEFNNFVQEERSEFSILCPAVERGLKVVNMFLDSINVWYHIMSFHAF